MDKTRIAKRAASRKSAPPSILHKIARVKHFRHHTRRLRVHLPHMWSARDVIATIGGTDFGTLPYTHSPPCRDGRSS